MKYLSVSTSTDFFQTANPVMTYSKGLEKITKLAATSRSQ
jgi:hypothetical protein